MVVYGYQCIPTKRTENGKTWLHVEVEIFILVHPSWHKDPDCHPSSRLGVVLQLGLCFDLSNSLILFCTLLAFRFRFQPVLLENFQTLDHCNGRTQL